MFWLTLLCLILLILIAQKVGVFAVIVDTDFFVLVEKITKNVYFSGVSCSIIAVIIIYKWQVWYSKKKLKQNFRCNECIQSIYNGIEKFREYAPLIPEKENDNCDYKNLKKKNAQRYAKFYNEHKCEIYSANLELSYEGNDLLIESIQSCFFINLNFKLLEILNNVKNRLPNLRENYPEIEKLEKKYKETDNEDVMIRLGEKLDIYFIDVKFMVDYWRELLDYLEYDPTLVRTFVSVYNKYYGLEKIPLSEEIQNNQMLRISREVRKTILRSKLRNFWKG